MVTANCMGWGKYDGDMKLMIEAYAKQRSWPDKPSAFNFRTVRFEVPNNPNYSAGGKGDSTFGVLIESCFT